MARTRQSKVRTALFFLGVFLIIFMALALDLNRNQASSVPEANEQVTAHFPTDYPPAKETLQFEARQTRQAGALTVTAWALTPSPTGTLWNFPSGYYEVTDVPQPTLAWTPAGDGALFNYPGGSFTCRLYGVCALNWWQIVTDGKQVTVYAGVDDHDTTNLQGEVAVTIYGPVGFGQHANLQDGGDFPTPDRTGPVHIVGAQGMRLILVSTQGKTYYFDVPSERFTSSLTDVIPTSTLWPTPSPYPTMPTYTPTLSGDAPHDPYDFLARIYSPIDTPLHQILYHAGDEQWFRFNLPFPGTIQVHLTQLPANYDLYVYSADRVRNYGHDGQSTNPGTMDELVTLTNLLPGDYMVRVVSVNSAFDPVHPYQLEFDVPASADDLRTETTVCVTDQGLINSLNAKIEHRDWNPFINEVEAQSGKKISSDCANQLVQMTTYLLNKSQSATMPESTGKPNDQTKPISTIGDRSH